MAEAKHTRRPAAQAAGRRPLPARHRQPAADGPPPTTRCTPPRHPPLAR